MGFAEASGPACPAPLAAAARRPCRRKDPKPLIFCHFARGLADKAYDEVPDYQSLFKTLTGGWGAGRECQGGGGRGPGLVTPACLYTVQSAGATYGTGTYLPFRGAGLACTPPGLPAAVVSATHNPSHRAQAFTIHQLKPRWFE